MGRKKKERPQEVLDLSLFTKSGKPRKRKPKTDRNYFTQETEDAIVKYLKSDDEREKNKLFNEKIYYSIYKLVENIINTFKFYYTDAVSIEELKHEVIIFLIEKFHRYDQNLGKAYSFFGTIAKRWLIIYNKKNYEKLKKKGVLEEVDEDEGIFVNISNENLKSDHILVLNDFVKHASDNIEEIFTDRLELDIAYAVMDIFKKRDLLDVFNKQVFYLQIKDLTGAETSQVTKVIKVLKSEYKKVQNLHYIKGDL